MKKKLVSLFIALTMVTGLMVSSVSAADVSSYTDLDRSNWYYSAVKYVSEQNIMEGISADKFSPMEKLTKQMFVNALYNIEKNVSDSTYSNKVTAMTWAKNTGVVAGDESGYVDAAAAITREELATMLYKYAVIKGFADSGSTYTADLSKYADEILVSDWARQQIKWAFSTGMLAGSDGYIKPQVNITRAETAVVLSRFMDTYVYPGTVKWYDVKSVNHRGYSAVAPENTLAAYRMSKQMGFEYVETDVTLTKDRVPVILHDNTINRTARYTDGTEIEEKLLASDLTLAELRQYDFGIYKGQQYAGEKIPTFEEFISLCSELGLNAYVELKSNGGFVKDDINYLMTIVDKYNMRDKVTWTSFSSELMTMVKDMFPSVRIGYLSTKVNEDTIKTAKSLMTSNNSVFIDAAQYNDEAVYLCKEAGIPLEVWTIDDESVIKSLSPYISGVTSNGVKAENVLTSK